MMKVCLRSSLAVVALFAAGCASTGATRGSGGELESRAVRALDLYLDCAHIHAEAMSGASGPASAVVDAALASCERRHARYCAATSEYLISVAPPDDRTQAHERAQARCSRTREDAHGVLIGRVEEARALAAERLEQAVAAAMEAR